MNTMKPLATYSKPSNQRGMALVMGLIFLVTLTLLGMAAMRGTILEERMAGNARDRNLAFQAAEVALRVGEQELLSPALPGMVLNTPRTPRIADATLSNYWQNTHVWDNTTSVAVPGALLEGVSAAPRYVIESLDVTSGGGGLVVGPISSAGLYRVTARGVGSGANTVVILQAIFERP